MIGLTTMGGPMKRLRPSSFASVRAVRPFVALVAVLTLVACAASASPPRSVPLRELNDSGVTGTAVLTDLGGGRTRVEVNVEPAGHADMPAHIHPGSCQNLTPQPRYPLENVVNGHSVTDVPASLAELTRGDVAVNLHNSNEDMRTYAACGEIR
jgi:hypothetical protein